MLIHHVKHAQYNSFTLVFTGILELSVLFLYRSFNNGVNASQSMAFLMNTNGSFIFIELYFSLNA